MSKKIIIIGSGISGLVSGCYLQMNDYQTEIFELHDKAGGLCTAWKRKDYTFEGCIHWLVGSNPQNSFYDIWQELNAFDNIEFIDHEESYKIIDGYEEFILYHNIEKLRSEMLRIAPEDEKAIISFLSDLENISRISIPIEKPRELFKFREILGMIFKQGKKLKLFNKFMKQTWGSYLGRFTNKKLQRYISVNVPSENFNALYALMKIGWQKKKVAGYPIGGSLPIVGNIVSTYLKYGGKINYSSRVVEILVEDNKAIGIRLETGEKNYADIIISAADGYNTIYELLKGKYLSPEIDNYYKEHEIYESICQVSFGINHKFEKTPHTIFYFPKEEISTDPKTLIDYLVMHIHSFDPTLAPDGKTVVTFTIKASDFEFWQNLRTNNHTKYNEEKERIANIALEILEKFFPGTRDKVEIRDVATPATYYRYTNNWQGSWEGWIPTPLITNKMKRTLPGLESFYMVSQWVNPGGGLPPALLAGRNIAQIICHEDKSVFITKH